MPKLSFTTLQPPQGLKNGLFDPWVIRWQIPDGTLNGFVIQHMQVIFQGVHDCDEDILSDDEIWNRLHYSGPTRLDYWEAWQFRDGIWQPSSDTDGWGFSQAGTFYSNDGEGVVIFKGSAGFYEGDDLNAFCVGWGANGDGEGSPMSGDLMSTTQTPTLPDATDVDRTMTVEWHLCECDSYDDVCRKTSVNTTNGAPEVQEA